MALSDLELLELVEKAQQRQKGERGEPGIGISAIEQFDGTSFTLRLTDGNFKKIDLPTAKDGEVGLQGVQGQRGEPGPVGRAGRDGKSGLDGADGVPGRDGSFVDTAIVNSNGHLLLGLSDGSVLDVGGVVGPVGATGERGSAGLPGKPGEDGAAVLSGPRAPQADDGFDGCHWIDLSSASFGFYKKSSGTWTKLGELRVSQLGQQQAAVGGSGGGGGNGELQNTRTLPLINGGSTIRKKAQARDLPSVPGKMDTQEDANLYFLDALSRAGVTVSESVPRPPSVEGQLWFCTAADDLTLYVYDGAVWVPAAPPVSLDGVQSAIASIDEQLLKVNANVAMNKSELDEKALDIQLDQDRQDAEIQELHEKVDGIAEEFDRGKWAHVTEKPTSGQYALGVKATKEYCQEQYAKCVEDAAGDPTKLSECTRQMGDCENEEDAGGSVYVSSWGGVDHISVHTEESDGETHGFADYTVGKYIEILNEGDEGNATYQITEDAVIADGIAVIAVADIQHTGKPSGLGRFKVFEMKSGDPTDYVRKTGDEMSGKLLVKPTSGNYSLVVFATPETTGATDIFRVRTHDNKQIFYVDAASGVGVNSSWEPTSNNHLVPKGWLEKYVSDEIASQASRHYGSPYRFRSHGIPTNLTEGEFTYDKDWNWYAHKYDAAGGRIGVSKEDGYTHDGMFKVYKNNGSIDHICIMHRYDVCKTGQKNIDYFEWRKKESVYTHVEWLEEGKTYYLSDGFLLPQ